MYAHIINMSIHNEVHMIHARRALLPEGWVRDLRVTVQDGRIAGLASDVAAATGDARVDTLLPALSNLHSHTFQRAMAGLTEHRVQGRESFWTWREVMYRFLDRLTPDDIQVIAAQAFVEMQEAGFAAVAEFHYLHHQPGGAAYADPAELSARIMAAAQDDGNRPDASAGALHLWRGRQAAAGWRAAAVRDGCRWFHAAGRGGAGMREGDVTRTPSWASLRIRCGRPAQMT